MVTMSRRTDREQHGKTMTTEYYVWSGMIARCLDENSPAFHKYGGRGICVHPSMRKFSGFLSVVGNRPDKNHSLDRINNDGNYEPGNVRWALKVVQARNTRVNRIINYQGKSQTLAAWAEDLNINQLTLSRRIDAFGWTLEEALVSEKFPPGPGKLSRDNVIDIFSSAGTHREIGKRFGVGTSMVGRIKGGLRWASITRDLVRPPALPAYSSRA